ncbi:MAG UNVERIFIED_CONTAM: hypothetical protein LVR18_41420 [Planctomycetaceae bacterium]
MLWLSPFWWLAMVPVLERAGRKLWSVTGLLLLISIVSVQWSLHRPWRPSWLYERLDAAGWINYRTPRPPFNPPRNTLFPKLPAPGVTETFVNSRGDRVTLRTRERYGRSDNQTGIIVEVTSAADRRHQPAAIRGGSGTRGTAVTRNSSTSPISASNDASRPRHCSRAADVWLHSLQPPLCCRRFSLDTLEEQSRDRVESGAWRGSRGV